MVLRAEPTYCLRIIRMAKTTARDLSRRERQIMEIVYSAGEATVAAIAAALPDPPSHTAVRTFLRILEDKGQIRRRKEGKKHIYTAAGSRTPPTSPE